MRYGYSTRKKIYTNKIKLNKVREVREEEKKINTSLFVRGRNFSEVP